MENDKEKRDFLDRVIFNPYLRAVFTCPPVLKFIACQFALESNFGTSALAIAFNNYCGMKKPFKRISYRNGVSGDFCTYHDFHFCCLDYISWFFYNRPYQNVIENLDSFIIFLRNSGYCPEKDYIDKIQSIYNSFFKN